MSFRKITVKSGNEEITMDVTEEEYQRYYRPWWRMKKKEQRNREAMEQNGYTEESYEGWKDGLTVWLSGWSVRKCRWLSLPG